MRSEIQSLEVSFFVQATEDERRTAKAVGELFGGPGGPERQELEGHYGNKIVWMRYHLTGDEAQRAFRTLVSRLGKEGRGALLREMGSLLDEHGSLFLRLGKQSAVQGSAVLSDSDPVRVKVKPRAFLLRGEPSRFYARLMEGA